ncbi:hypothetical protein HGRIS_010008 [Hohenbuehelia grisea]|uniref:F-box domain-containing protein n=1 Tax=Hohenbuehelia grisea TaxID=104357 RepID=A0ABR3J2Y1_9AGAR
MLDSPFVHALGTAYVPTQDEISAVEALMKQPLEEILCMDETINQLENHLKQLRDKRRNLNEYVMAHKALVSHGRRLPADVLVNIFSHCLSTEHKPVCSTHTPPLVFGQICRSWREISRSTPRLWSRIHIVVPVSLQPSEFDIVARARCDGIRAWLNRSGVLPLFIALVTPPATVDTTPLVKQFLRVISEFCPRWWEVDVHIPDRSYPLLETLLMQGLPILEAIRMASTPEPHGVRNPSNEPASAIASSTWTLVLSPKLREFSIIYPLRIRLSVPRQQLTTLSVGRSSSNKKCLPPDGAVSLLSRCNETLEACSLAIASHNAIFQPFPAAIAQNPLPSFVPRMITFPKLQKLCIDNSDPLESCRDFFSCLAVPALEELEFAHRPKDQDGVLSALPFSVMLAQSASALKSLTIEMSTITDDILIPCLAALPSLETLTVKNSTHSQYIVPSHIELTDRLLAALTPGSKAGSPALCLRLQSFTFKNCGFTEAALVKLLLSSCGSPSEPGVSRLRSARNHFPHEPHLVLPGEEHGADLKPIIKEIIDSGVEVTFTYACI